MQTTKRKTYRIGALGCRTNQYEAQAFKDQLEAIGYTQADDGEVASVSIINSCTVTESADASSRHMVRDFIRKSPGETVVVTGCYAEQNPELLQNIPGVTEVVSNKDKERLVELLFPEEKLPEFSIKRFDAHTRAFVKVQDGCNSFCTYCIIPYVRGRSRSRTIDDVVQEVTILVNEGYKEVVITGINVGDFDGAKPKGQKPDTLADLVRAVDQVEGLKRLRISSIDPDEVDDDLLDAVINGKRTCNSMHIVLQAGSNHVLKRMNRKYTRQQFFDTVRRLQAADPDFTITTDIIVGFPGETDHDFQETLDVVESVQFSKVHMFPYSRRPRTKAATYKENVSPDIIRKRKAHLLTFSEQMAYKLREKYVGNVMEVLTEGAIENGYITGHTTNFLPVLIESDSLASNTLVNCFLEANSEKGLIGKVVEKGA